MYYSEILSPQGTATPSCEQTPSQGHAGIMVRTLCFTRLCAPAMFGTPRSAIFTPPQHCFEQPVPNFSPFPSQECSERPVRNFFAVAPTTTTPRQCLQRPVPNFSGPKQIRTKISHHPKQVLNKHCGCAKKFGTDRSKLLSGQRSL